MTNVLYNPWSVRCLTFSCNVFGKCKQYFRHVGFIKENSKNLGTIKMEEYYEAESVEDGTSAEIRNLKQSSYTVSVRFQF